MTTLTGAFENCKSRTSKYGIYLLVHERVSEANEWVYSVHARETRGNAEKMSSPVYSVEGSTQKIPISFFFSFFLVLSTWNSEPYCSIVVEVVEASSWDIWGPARSHHVGFVYAWCYFAAGQQTPCSHSARYFQVVNTHVWNRITARCLGSKKRYLMGSKSNHSKVFRLQKALLDGVQIASQQGV